MNMHIEAILRCPITHTDLIRLDNCQIEELNDAISKGNLCHLDGSLVRNNLKSAFACSNGMFIYPVEDDIVILLPSLAITPNEDKIKVYAHKLAADKKDVMDFYDQVGWQENDKGIFEDAAKFEDLRPVAKEYIHRCHMRLKQYILDRGTYLLDIASGPIQVAEYLTYSSGYDYRICADISFVALKQAKKKLGDRGIYLLCDITNLPLRNDTVDGFVSLHTIYHVPAEEQIKAVKELYRVLKDGSSGVIVYSWGNHSFLMNIMMMPFHLVHAIKKVLRRLLPNSVVNQMKKMLKHTPEVRDTRLRKSAQQLTKSEEPKLYFHTHDFTWYEHKVKHSFNSDIVSWRSVSLPFLKKFVHDRLFGKQLLSFLYFMESTFPHFFGRYGQYPMFIFNKGSLTKGLGKK